jgi:hypothetical protein
MILVKTGGLDHSATAARLAGFVVFLIAAAVIAIEKLTDCLCGFVIDLDGNLDQFILSHDGFTSVLLIAR